MSALDGASPCSRVWLTRASSRRSWPRCRAFAAFAEGGLLQQIHEHLIAAYTGPKLVGYISRDAKAIKALERLVRQPQRTFAENLADQPRPPRCQHQLDRMGSKISWIDYPFRSARSVDDRPRPGANALPHAGTAVCLRRTEISCPLVFNPMLFSPVSRPGSLQRTIRRLPLLIALTLLLGGTAVPAGAAPAVFTDSAAAGLAGTKRVAITNVMVSFQASTGAQTSTNGLLANKSDTSSVLQMPDMDPKLLAAITDEVYAQLKTDLTANGFEVIPEATVLASPTYQKIIQLAGITNFSKFANREGDIMLVGAADLKPYFPYVAEGGGFNYPSTTRYIKGWVSGMGVASSTEGGPSATSIQSTYALPGLEVALAKELNAHVVKATYVVTLGSTKAGINGRFSDFNTHTGEAFAQVSLKAGQSRIAFRTAAGKTKGQSVSVSKPLPAKDGDVVVTLAEPLFGGSAFFNVQSSSKGKGAFGLGGGADKQVTFSVSLTNPTAYRTEVTGLIKEAQTNLLALVKQ